MSKKYDSLLAEYKTLAKRADDRLRALEVLSRTKHFEGVKNFAYAKAMEDIRSYGSDGKRFMIKPPTNTRALEGRLNDIKRFLEMPTSTKRGIVAIYKKRTDTLNAKYGLNITWQEAATYYEKENDRLFDTFNITSSDEAIVLGAMKKIKNWQEKTIQDAIKDNKFVDEYGVEGEIINELLKQGIRYEDVFK